MASAAGGQQAALPGGAQGAPAPPTGTVPAAAGPTAVQQVALLPGGEQPAAGAQLVAAAREIVERDPSVLQHPAVHEILQREAARRAQRAQRAAAQEEGPGPLAGPSALGQAPRYARWGAAG